MMTFFSMLAFPRLGFWPFLEGRLAIRFGDHFTVESRHYMGLDEYPYAQDHKIIPPTQFMGNLGAFGRVMDYCYPDSMVEAA